MARPAALSMNVAPSNWALCSASGDAGGPWLQGRGVRSNPSINCVWCAMLAEGQGLRGDEHAAFSPALSGAPPEARPMPTPNHAARPATRTAVARRRFDGAARRSIRWRQGRSRLCRNTIWPHLACSTDWPPVARTATPAFTGTGMPADPVAPGSARMNLGARLL